MRITYQILLSTFILSCAVDLNAWGSVPFSKYGTIQNVDNYSSNPFYTPDSPYNTRMPTPVYVTGNQIDAPDCQRIVAQLIASICARANNCASLQLSDIRPQAMLQLSKMPNGNYATACAGYLDTEFMKYTNAGSRIETNAKSAFPTINSGVTSYTTNTAAPFTQPIPRWQQEALAREQELLELRAANGETAPKLIRTDFPTTFADLSFEEQVKELAAGYAPYKKSQAYHPIQIVIEKEEQKPAPTPANGQPITKREQVNEQSTVGQEQATDRQPVDDESNPIIIDLTICH